MPTMICKNKECRSVRSYRNQRGVRIADFTCECGSGFQQAVYEQGKWVPRIPRKQPKRVKHNCHFCGRAGLAPSSRMKVMEEDTDFAIWDKEAEGYVKATAPAGSAVCWIHYRADSHCGKSYLKDYNPDANREAREAVRESANFREC